jgi:NADH-quinone oxidoreductase subunit A
MWRSISGERGRACLIYLLANTQVSDTTMLRQYLPILIFMGLAGGLGVVLFTLGWIAGPRRPDPEKLSPYECGFEAFEDSRIRFDVRYYLVAIIFIVFDLEIAFFFPWAVSLKATGVFGLVAMAIFALVLVVALVYDYRRGALEWD